jgi:YesN/AraC family two-component response regulator
MANPTMIVADDDEMIRDVLFSQLTAKGYDVRIATDGNEAWELFRKQPSEILITDLEMPRMTGQELIAKVKEHSPDTIIIVLTGHGTLDSARKIIDIGCDEYLVKPIKNIEMGLVLKRSLERHHLLMQAMISKRINMAKSKMIHELTYDLVEPTYTLLNSIDTLIHLIKENDSVKTLATAEDIKNNVSKLFQVVSKLSENSDRLKSIEEE